MTEKQKVYILNIMKIVQIKLNLYREERSVRLIKKAIVIIEKETAVDG